MMIRYLALCIALLIQIPATTAYGEESVVREAALATLDRLNRATSQLSRSSEAPFRDPRANASLHRSKALMNRINVLVQDAHHLLNRKEIDRSSISHLESEFGNALSELRKLQGDVNMLSTKARNEGDKIKGLFQGWQEKANQLDQQLTSILRIFKDIGRIGVGGSDLGAS